MAELVYLADSQTRRSAFNGISRRAPSPNGDILKSQPPYLGKTTPRPLFFGWPCPLLRGSSSRQSGPSRSSRHIWTPRSTPPKLAVAVLALISNR